MMQKVQSHVLGCYEAFLVIGLVPLPVAENKQHLGILSRHILTCDVGTKVSMEA